MPTYDDRKKTVNYYGVFALWASLLLLASYFSLFTSGCEQIASMQIQICLAIIFLSGLLLFALSFCNIARRLYQSKFIFYFIVIILIAISIALIFLSYQTWNHDCKSGRYYERNNQLLLLSNNYNQNINKNNSNYININNNLNKKEEFEQTLQSILKKRNNHYNVSALLDLIASILFMSSAYAFRNRF